MLEVDNYRQFHSSQLLHTNVLYRVGYVLYSLLRVVMSGPLDLV